MRFSSNPAIGPALLKPLIYTNGHQFGAQTRTGVGDPGYMQTARCSGLGISVH
jgi:hypothetical protein